MLKLFEVSGYKNFDKKITLDFSDVRDFQFNAECINDGLLGKIIIYGKNGIGKSNFCKALYDVENHIFKSQPVEYDATYLNVNSENDYAEFRYILQFNEHTVEYLYRKTAFKELVYEKVVIDDKLLFEVDKRNPWLMNVAGLEEHAPSLNKSFEDFEQVDCVFSYVVANTPLGYYHPLKQAHLFLQLSYMDNRGEYLSASGRISSDEIVNTPEVLAGFQELLVSAGIHETVDILADPMGKKKLYFNTNPERPLLFDEAASSGTKALCNFFRLFSGLMESGAPGAYILDEFDAYYHYELSEHIVKMIKSLKYNQVIFTTHNTTLMSNYLMRPDCLFILSEDGLTSLANATTRELREGHNLSKLYMGGDFDA